MVRTESCTKASSTYATCTKWKNAALQRKIEAVFFNLLKISYLLAVLDLRCSAGFYLVVGSGGYSLVVVGRLLSAVASPQ